MDRLLGFYFARKVVAAVNDLCASFDLISFVQLGTQVGYNRHAVFNKGSRVACAYFRTCRGLHGTRPG
jgi:hypothetical protein